MSNDLDLPIAGLGDLYGIAQVSDTALDLDAVVEELLEGGEVEDLIGDRLGGVDHELLSGVSLVYGGGLLLGCAFMSQWPMGLGGEYERNLPSS